MIHAIRKLAREVHRRSVWQVLGVYLALAWACLYVVEWVSTVIGLPWWTPTLTIVLFALGLPVVIATAVVQGGLKWLRIEDEVDPNELVGLTPDQVHVIPEAHPLYGAGVLTWRNAILLGVMSAALLVTSVVAYLTMWALGIGPVGSLLAQGVIRPSDAVVVTDFENRTDEMLLAQRVSDLFGMELAGSELVTIRSPEEVVQEMGRGARPVSPAVVLQIAEESGYAAMVEGDVSRVGSNGYRIVVRIVLLPAGTPVGRFRATARDRGELVPAIDELAERVRAKLGESLRVIRAEPALVDVHGPNIDG